MYNISWCLFTLAAAAVPLLLYHPHPIVPAPTRVCAPFAVSVGISVWLLNTKLMLTWWLMGLLVRLLCYKHSPAWRPPLLSAMPNCKLRQPNNSPRLLLLPHGWARWRSSRGHGHRLLWQSRATPLPLLTYRMGVFTGNGTPSWLLYNPRSWWPSSRRVHFMRSVIGWLAGLTHTTS